jgi:hypothetical protein
MDLVKYNNNKTKNFILIDFKDFILIDYVKPKNTLSIVNAVFKLKEDINNLKDLIYNKTSLIIEQTKSICLQMNIELDSTIKITKFRKESEIIYIVQPGIPQKVGVLDKNKIIIDTCSSLRKTSEVYGIPRTTLSQSYLNKDRLYKNKYYFITINQKRAFSSIIKVMNTKNLLLNELISIENKNMSFSNKLKSY